MAIVYPCHNFHISFLHRQVTWKLLFENSKAEMLVCLEMHKMYKYLFL